MLTWSDAESILDQLHLESDSLGPEQLRVFVAMKSIAAKSGLIDGSD